MVGEAAEGAVETGVEVADLTSLEAEEIASRTVRPARMGPASLGRAGVQDTATTPLLLAAEATGGLVDKLISVRIGNLAHGGTG